QGTDGDRDRWTFPVRCRRRTDTGSIGSCGAPRRPRSGALPARERANMSVKPTPFHWRTAAANTGNAWTERCGYTVASGFTDAIDEALAARMSVLITDISWRWRIVLEGPRAADCLACLMTRDPHALAPGQAQKALWLNDAGAVRGAGAIVRLAEDRFMLV